MKALNSLTIALLVACLGIVRAAAPAAGTSSPHDGQHDFDYLIGSWNIHRKKLLHPLTGSNEWVEFDGTTVCRTVWNGNAEQTRMSGDKSAGR